MLTSISILEFSASGRLGDLFILIAARSASVCVNIYKQHKRIQKPQESEHSPKIKTTYTHPYYTLHDKVTTLFLEE